MTKHTEKRKRGRPKTGRALTNAQHQANYRARQMAKLAASDEGEQWDVPEMYFPNALTLDELMAKVSPEFRGELAREATREEAAQERDDGSDD
jgi:hypothetical protein